MTTQFSRKLRVALVGHGAIGKNVARAIICGTHGLYPSRISLVAILVQNPREEGTLDLGSGDGPLLTHDADAFFKLPFDICVECAGQSVVRQYAADCLRAGRNFLCTSIGALTDDALMEELQAAALEGHSQFQLASGAMPGIDWMSSSALEATSSIKATQTKPSESWLGARFQPGTTEALPDVVDFQSLTEPTTFFEGTARDAAAYYPKNSNILAMLALSAATLDETQVKLVADPINKSIRQTIEYEGAAGSISINVCGKKSATNPRTSQVVPLSVIKALRNMSSPIAIGL